MFLLVPPKSQYPNVELLGGRGRKSMRIGTRITKRSDQNDIDVPYMFDLVKKFPTRVTKADHFGARVTKRPTFGARVTKKGGFGARVTKKGGFGARVTRMTGNFGARVTKRDNFGARVTKKSEPGRVERRVTQKSNVGTRITKKNDSGNRDTRQTKIETRLNKRPRFGTRVTKRSNFFDCANYSWFRTNDGSLFKRCVTFPVFQNEDSDQAHYKDNVLSLTKFLMNHY